MQHEIREVPNNRRDLRRAQQLIHEYSALCAKANERRAAARRDLCARDAEWNARA